MQSNEARNQPDLNHLKIVTYNCKNMETSTYAIDQLSKRADIIMVQEHWYFDCQLGKLGTVCEKMAGTGKAVDTGDPILPVQMPRCYGGVGFLWRKSMDQTTNSVQDGANRIQCIELQLQIPILIDSVYMPCRGLKEDIDDFEDCLAQLHEIVPKFRSTHYLFLGGGDFNEDITSTRDSKRLQSLNQFLDDADLTTKTTKKTYVGPNGVELSTIDFIFYSKPIESRILSISVIDDLAADVSDHYPVCCTTDIRVEDIATSKDTIPPPRRVRWDKVDQTYYQQVISEAVKTLRTDATSLGSLDDRICKLNQFLVSASVAAGPPVVRRVRRAKLETWPLRDPASHEGQKTGI